MRAVITWHVRNDGCALAHPWHTESSVSPDGFLLPSVCVCVELMTVPYLQQLYTGAPPINAGLAHPRCGRQRHYKRAITYFGICWTDLLSKPVSICSVLLSQEINRFFVSFCRIYSNHLPVDNHTVLLLSQYCALRSISDARYREKSFALDPERTGMVMSTGSPPIDPPSLWPRPFWPHPFLSTPLLSAPFLTVPFLTAPISWVSLPFSHASWFILTTFCTTPVDACCGGYMEVFMDSIVRLWSSARSILNGWKHKNAWPALNLNLHIISQGYILYCSVTRHVCYVDVLLCTGDDQRFVAPAVYCSNYSYDSVNIEKCVVKGQLEIWIRDFA